MGKKHSWFPVALISLTAVAFTLVAGCGGGEPQAVEIAVTIRDDQMSPDTIQVKQDDTVTLRIDSDIPGAFHLHGYDIEREVRPGDVTNLSFTADATGRYRIAFHKAGDEPGSSHGHGSMSHDAIESEVPVSVEIGATQEPGGGVNVYIDTENWRWAPEEVNRDHTPGAGHAHIYVDGKKINRVYGPAYHLTRLEPGMHEIRVTLNANSHNELLVDGDLVEDSVMVTAKESDDVVSHNAEPVPIGTSWSGAAPHSPLVITVMPDALGGYNFLAIAGEFRFAPEKVGLSHVAGEGYGEVRVDGEVVTRLYGPWFKSPDLEPGPHEFTFTLFTNDHRPYVWEGRAVEVTSPIEVKMEMERSSHHGDGEGDDGMRISAQPVEEEIDLGFLEVHPR